MNTDDINILFPGRHHMLTKFQQQYLRDLVMQGVGGKHVRKIIFAVTSANHENTRRNPVPLYLRAMAIDEFARELPCDFKIYPIPDVRATDHFAKYILNQIFYESGEHLAPENTILACSTPPVISLFTELGFQHVPVEFVEDAKEEGYKALRPYEVIDLLVQKGLNWRSGHEWREYASLATQNIYDKYSLGDLIVEVFQDALLNDDADITDTRDYNTYAFAMDNIINIKFEDIRPFVVNGKVVDVGCSTGSLVRLLSKEFNESDVIGVEATRKFYEFCRSQEYPNPNVFFYRRNITDQNFKENSINTFIYSSILHEIYSYIGEPTLHTVLKNSLAQLAPGGHVIIRDVVGPENPDKEVYMWLRDDDGVSIGDPHVLSTYAKFFRFVKDFLPRKISYREETLNEKKYIYLRLQDAYEFMSKKNYTDNWDSEMHEEFGFYSFSKWQNLLQEMGYEIAHGSRTFLNPHILEHSYQGNVALFTRHGDELVPEPYPPTNMILVGEKPFA
jgi:SAM-dependent methyltransferase